MTKYLGIELSALVERGGGDTAREIEQQPELWQKLWENVSRQAKVLREFMERAVSRTERIILTGAGTSAFIGQSLAGILQRKTGLIAQAIPTTDLVSHPKDYLLPSQPVFLISFARSGNSPESVAAASMVNEISGTTFHLIITCNPEGNLARFGPEDGKLVLALPAEANDQGLAMTSSYTGMLLAGILLTHLDHLKDAKKSVDTLTGYGRKVIDYYCEELARIAEKDFRRAVFLGSGPFYGTAKESHLKVQELTDGKIICKEDSFLGLRHGPKAVIDETTLVCYLFSNDPYASAYERDLVHAMKKGRPPLLEMGVMETRIPGISLDHIFYLSENGSRLSEEYLPVVSVLPSQILGFFKSLNLGLRPDNPSLSGAITRVVEGVQIYDLKT